MPGTVEPTPPSPLPPSSPPARADDADEGRSILSTLNDDGSRRWLSPRLSRGRFLSGRRIVAYGLIALFAALPLIHVNGKPVVLLDIIARRFHILGFTFHPTDTLLLALLLVSVFLLIFWTTALLGRVWCGWACPQTVYMEFVYRPLERFFEGAPGRAKKGWLQTSGAGKPLKYAAYFVCSFVIAHLFLAYFVPWSELRRWVFSSPGEHPIGFAVVAFVTGAMLFDFAYFREQVCLVACPYGRFQSVMLDRHSMIIRYDQPRGEPRGPARKKSSQQLPVLNVAPAGDCIDCRMCVTTCPTGIDIRNGLQMECIGCAQCIDACDAVMDKIERPRGLIRYSSQAAMQGERFRILRARVLLYPAVVGLLLSLFAVVLLNTGTADITVMRGLGQPFNVTSSGEVENNVRIKIVNRLDRPAEFALSVAAAGGGGGAPDVRLTAEHATSTLDANSTITVPVQVYAPRAAFAGGKASIMLTVRGPDGFTRSIPFTLLGPASSEPHP